MDEFNIIGMEESGMPESSFGKIQEESSALPAKISIWSKFKNFLLQDVEEMQLVMTPGEQKFVDFWTQKVTIDDMYNFMFKPIKFK
ncbi:MAG: hypothetical protein FWF46_01565 [Oscillospiraceae bacterium]|nr:hypothetical protein [Oscillospiraceae bacterium]